MRDFLGWLTLTVIVFSILMSMTIKAEVDVGASPDPYEKIWATATEEDMEALRQCIYYESVRAFEADDNKQVKCNIATCETVLNRCLQEGTRFRKTIKGVVYQPGEFCVKKRTIRNARVEEAIEHVRKNGRTALPDYDYVHFGTNKQSIAKDHVYFGNGKTGMYFGRAK